MSLYSSIKIVTVSCVDLTKTTIVANWSLDGRRVEKIPSLANPNAVLPRYLAELASRHIKASVRISEPQLMFGTSLLTKNVPDGLWWDNEVLLYFNRQWGNYLYTCVCCTFKINVNLCNVHHVHVHQLIFFSLNLPQILLIHLKIIHEVCAVLMCWLLITFTKTKSFLMFILYYVVNQSFRLIFLAK